MSDHENDTIWQGDGRTFDDAANDAWSKARDEEGPGYYRVIATYVLCENPIREYKVKIVREDP